MSVTTLHAEYSANARRWKRCRDVIDGRDAILATLRRCFDARGQRLTLADTDYYLPPLSGQQLEDYVAYAMRASFFGATGRTLDAYTGLIFAKDPQWKLPTAIQPYESDVTLGACNLREFSEQVVEEQGKVGRVGVLVDHPQTPAAGLSQADAERLNVRPFMRWYAAESILNWRTAVVNGAEVLTLVVLQETRDVAKNDFETESETVYRVLDLVDGKYRIRLLNDKDEPVEDEVYPLMRGKPMDFIPFVIIGVSSCTPKVQKPPLLDIAEVNIAHFRNAADYEHGLHFTGLPQPYVAGAQLAEGASLNIGSASAWVFTDPNAKAEYLEFKGEGLGTLAAAMKEKEHRMAVLGAKMLADDKRVGEAQGTVELKTSAERSVLASIARTSSDGIRRCLDWMAEWVGAPAQTEFALNTDYGAHRIEPQMLTALMLAAQGGGLTQDELFYNLQRGDLIQPDKSFEDHQTQIADEAPKLTDAPAESGNLMSKLRARMGL